MDEVEFEMRKTEITNFIKNHNSKYYNDNDDIMKIRLLNKKELYCDFRGSNEWVYRESDLMEIENESEPHTYANYECYEDEKKIFDDIDNETQSDIFLMFKCGDELHTLREIGSRDKEGNTRLPAWLCEEHFKTERLFPKYKQESLLREEYLDSGWTCMFPVFVIYGESKEEEKPITEASRIILEETKNRIQKPVINYTPDYLNIKWTDYIKENTEMYDEKFFALVTTKGIRETINWKWICEELNKNPD